MQGVGCFLCRLCFHLAIFKGDQKTDSLITEQMVAQCPLRNTLFCKIKAQ